VVVGIVVGVDAVEEEEDDDDDDDDDEEEEEEEEATAAASNAACMPSTAAFSEGLQPEAMRVTGPCCPTAFAL
jgi:hypothetical protein